MKSYAPADFQGRVSHRGAPWQAGLSFVPITSHEQSSTSGGTDLTETLAFNAIAGGGQYNFSTSSPQESGFMAALQASGVAVYVSMDNGATWDQIGGDPTGVDPDQPLTVACSTSEVLALFGGWNYSFGEIWQAVTGGSSPTYVRHSLTLNLEAPPANSQYVTAKAGNVWFVGGFAPGTTNTAISRTSNSFAIVGTAPTFTRTTVDATTTTHPSCLSAGPVNASLNVGVVLANRSSKIYFATAASPTSWTTVTVPGGIPISRAVYSAWHGKWLIMTHSPTPSAAVMGYTFAPRDLATPANWAQVKLTAGPSGFNTSVGFDQCSAPAAVGEWCYFTTVRGGSNSGILATPDLGDTWYLLSMAALTGSGGTFYRGYPVGVTAHQGRAYAAVMSPTGEGGYTKLYTTPLLEMPPASWVKAP